MTGIQRVLRLVTKGSLTALFCVVTAGVAYAQDPAPTAPTTKTDPAEVQAPSGATSKNAPLPVDVEDVKERAAKQPAVKLDDKQLRFYVLIQDQLPTFSQIVGTYDLHNGATKGGAPMTYQEFVNMATPKELNELFGATSGSSFAMAQAAAMNAAGQVLIKKAVQELRQAHSDREVQQIRERIDHELTELGDTPSSIDAPAPATQAAPAGH